MKRKIVDGMDYSKTNNVNIDDEVIEGDWFCCSSKDMDGWCLVSSWAFGQTVRALRAERRKCRFRRPIKNNEE